MVIEAAKSAEIAPIVIEAYSLTARERDVLGRIARGGSTAEIAAELFLSPHTVRDYVKAVFEKLERLEPGRTRRPLVRRALLRPPPRHDGPRRLTPSHPARSRYAAAAIERVLAASCRSLRRSATASARSRARHARDPGRTGTSRGRLRRRVAAPRPRCGTLRPRRVRRRTASPGHCSAETTPRSDGDAGTRAHHAGQPVASSHHRALHQVIGAGTGASFKLIVVKPTSSRGIADRRGRPVEDAADRTVVHENVAGPQIAVTDPRAVPAPAVRPSGTRSSR